MGDYQKPDFGHLSDREILIIMATQSDVIHGRIEDHGKRLRALERIVYPALALATVIGGWFKFRAHVE